MPGPADFIQTVVHALETGPGALWLRRILIVAGLLGVTAAHLINFRGLATAQAMDQAQIGRLIASGKPWHTRFIRPLAIGQLQAHGRDVKQKIWRDTYHAPLPSFLNGLALFPFKSYLGPSSATQVALGDKVIVLLSAAIFFASVAVFFFVARRLFDQRIAILVCSLMLLCDLFWQYSFSGLPQMLLLLLFNATLYAIVRAVETKYSGGPVGLWLVGVGAGFGLLALTHAGTIWIFLAALVFSIVFFRPRGPAAAIMIAAFVLIYTPWLLRNYIVCGNPGGVAIYALIDGVRYSEAGWMRSVSPDFSAVTPSALRDKIVSNLFAEGGRIFEYLGWSVVAVSFFAALLHVFRRTETNMVRWMVLVLWLGAVFGMALLGLKEEQGFTSNQFHLLFIPIMSCYGLAWLLVQWNRFNLQIQFARIAFVTGLFVLCALPMVNSICSMLFGKPRQPIRWPPYVPPFIALINPMMPPNEVTASDIPWAVAWYADRPAIWVPDTLKTMTEMSDYGLLGVPIRALYLTPVSGTQNTLGDVVNGEYRDWAAVIQKTATPDKLPFKWGTGLGFNNEAFFLSDHDRSVNLPK